MGAVILEEHYRDERPLGKSPKTSFKLPDAETDVWIYTTGNGSGTDYFIGSGDRTLARWKTDVRTSPPARAVELGRDQHSLAIRL
ncbi:hypothetical protein NM208_g6145 [Fusarium decemcellulare]|uniref:Uncharacterized protein n=1 Tax=Fusarium decemcellulare TaxID=57161 RepID=A0ACC1SEG0_9HYPO|nr:hypothetical protein NM208_g6145 [Fusarium decemcellulare]